MTEWGNLLKVKKIKGNRRSTLARFNLDIGLYADEDGHLSAKLVP